MPILGTLGIFPAPTRDLYNTDAAFNFINVLMNTASYISILMAIVNTISVIALWTKREALASILMLPITANVVGFHAFLDGGLLTGGAIMGNILLVLNLYFLYINWNTINGLLIQRKK
jgi:hypothetical protein